MKVLLKLTSAGLDTGPFNLFSNATNFTVAFETNVNKAALVAGYEVTVSNNTTIIRVQSSQNCINYIDIPLVFPTTTTTTTIGASTTSTSSTSSTTTTTTTAVPTFPSDMSGSYDDPSAACLASATPLKVYSYDNPIVERSVVYSDETDLPYPGGGNWYRIGLNAYQIDGSGIVLDIVPCPL